MMPPIHRPLVLFLVGAVAATAADWPQDGGNAQRTGWTPEEPALPWKFAWTWNGPDEHGGPTGHRYHQPKPHQPWEARICVGGDFVFAPAGDLGMYALRVADGTEAWHFDASPCHTTPAYDAASSSLFVGTADAAIIRLGAADGAVRHRAATDGPVAKALLLADDLVYALTASGALHAFDSATLAPRWTYHAGAGAATSPAWSERAGLVVFCTQDLRVHAVRVADGRAHWIENPTPLTAQSGEHTVEFDGGWPVIAERHGLVFVRLTHSDIDTVLWSGGGPRGRWPTTTAAIRQRLVDHPELQNLFALRLADGQPAFVPAVGPAGVEDMRAGRPRLRVGTMPVIRPIEATEVAYLPWRHGDTQDPAWDGRWDSHLGEMVLDDDTIPGLAAGDLRFVQFVQHGGWLHITDEACPLSMAGDTIFYAHWDASSSARLINRSPDIGGTRTSPIPTEKRPPVVRHLRLPPEAIHPATRWYPGGLSLVDGRWLDGPGWWVYANTLDPPTPARSAYSEGILPRYTLVAGGHVVVQGNGADLFVLRHSAPDSP